MTVPLFYLLFGGGFVCHFRFGCGWLTTRRRTLRLRLSRFLTFGCFGRLHLSMGQITILFKNFIGDVGIHLREFLILDSQKHLGFSRVNRFKQTDEEFFSLCRWQQVGLLPISSIGLED